MLDKKKTFGTILGIGSVIIGTGLLLINGKSSQTVKKVIDTVASEPMFRNIPLSKLKDLAKEVNFKNELFLDSDGNLKLLYKSNRGHQTNVAKLGIDMVTKKLVLLNGGTIAYPGQRYSHADAFLKAANENFQFI